MKDAARIAREHALLLEAIAATPGPVAVYDDLDRLIAWNPAYARLHAAAFAANHEAVAARALRYEDVVRASALSLAPHEDLDAHVAERLAAHRLADGAPVDRNYDNFGWMRVTKMRTPSGAVAGFAMDISELVEKTAALEASRAAEAGARAAAERAAAFKSRFIASLSHEVRTPLNGVLGMAEALAETPMTPAQREMLDVLRAAGDHMLQVLNDVLDLAQVEHEGFAVHAAPFSVTRLCREVAALYTPSARKKGLSLDAASDPDGPDMLLGDAVRIRQVLSNFTANAVKFTSAGGVRIRALARPTAEGAELRLDVEDDGPGMSEAEAASLFRDFAQLPNGRELGSGGSGLGLSICQRLADAMGGRVAVRAAPGLGSVFSLTLPVGVAVSQAGEDASAAAPSATPAGRPLRLLVADDNPINRQVIEALLQPLGADLVEAENGVEALLAWEAGGFDAVLMDSQMPRMTGAETAMAIRAREAATGRPRTPIISVSASASAADLARFRAAGIDDCVPKPLSRAALMEALRRVTG